MKPWSSRRIKVQHYIVPQFNLNQLQALIFYQASPSRWVEKGDLISKSHTNAVQRKAGFIIKCINFRYLTSFHLLSLTLHDPSSRGHVCLLSKQYFACGKNKSPTSYNYLFKNPSLKSLLGFCWTFRPERIPEWCLSLIRQQVAIITGD